MSFFHTHNSHPSNGGTEMNDNETPIGFLKIVYVWLATVVANKAAVVMNMALADWLQVAALIFTLAQLYFLVRDRWWRDRKQRSRRDRKSTRLNSSHSDRSRMPSSA